MIPFVGILNTGGRQKKIRMYIDLKETEHYFTEVYLGDKKLEAKVEGTICTIYAKRQCNSILSFINCICGYDDQIVFDLTHEFYSNEIIITGREPNKKFLYCFPRPCKPKFFVVTNKEEV